jgi:hypothetical protein
MFRNIKLNRTVRTNLTTLCAMLIITGLATSAAQAVYTTGNLVVDPGFEANPLISYAQVLGPPYTTGMWSAENGAITGPASGIVPADGVKMLELSDDGLVATQSFQLVDVTAYATDISAGIVTVDASAQFNVPQDVAAGTSAVNVGFYNAAHGFLSSAQTTSSVLPGAFLDSNPGTWQTLNVTSFPVPVNTAFMLIQPLFANASMVNAAGAARPGYVDHSSLTLTAVPEPSSLVLAGLAMGGALWMWRRRAVAN